MTEDIFKAPKNRKPVNRHDFEHHHSACSLPKRKKTKEDFYTFCTMIMEYTQYESQRQEELRAQNNISPLDSSGSTADSYTSDTTTHSPEHSSSHLGESDDESWELITCFCLKPYAGRPMIECSECATWIHLSCAKIRKNNIPDTYTCQNCKDSRYTTRKSNRIRIDNSKFMDV